MASGGHLWPANCRHLCPPARGEGGPEAELASPREAASGAPGDPLFFSVIRLWGPSILAASMREPRPYPSKAWFRSKILKVE